MKKYFLIVLCFWLILPRSVKADAQNYKLSSYKKRISSVQYQRLRFALEPLLIQAAEALKKNDFNEAYHYYKKALALDNENYKVKESLINVCVSLKLYEEADRYIEEILAVNELYIPVLIKQAYMFRKKKENEKALAVFKKVYSLMSPTDDNKVDIKREIVYTAEALGDDKTVIEHSSFKGANYSQNIEFSRIKSLWREQKYNEALAAAKKFFKKSSKQELKKSLWGYILMLSVERNEIDKGLWFLKETHKRFYSFDTALDFLYAIKRKKEYDLFLEATAIIQTLGTQDQQQSEVLVYEKAQVYRDKGDNSAYLAEMKKLTQVSGSISFLREYADKLFKEGNYAEAYSIVEKVINQTTDKDIKYRQTIILAVILTEQGKIKEAGEKLAEALQYQEADLEWKLNAANIAYAGKEYLKCIKILKEITDSEITDRERITLGYSYYKNDMVGISLHHLKQVKAIEILTPEELYNYYINSLYIMFSYGLYEDILEILPKVDAFGKTYINDIIRIKSLGRVGKYDKVIEDVEAINDNYPIGIEEKNDIYLELARAFSAVAPQNRSLKVRRYQEIINDTFSSNLKLNKYKLKDDGAINRYIAVIDLYTKVLEDNSALSDPYYERALAYQHIGELELARADLEKLFEINKNPPVMAYGDMAAICVKLKDDEAALTYFEKYLKFYNYSLDALSNAGYTLVRLVKNNYAKCIFSHALDIYNRINPIMEDPEKEAVYLNKAHNLRKELSSLDKNIGVYPFVEINNFNLEDEQATLVRGLPSQIGCEVSWRPPVIGFRDYRILELYVGASTRLEQKTRSILQDYTQGVFGLRYKPLKSFNLILAGEKHYEIGKFSRDDYLLRVMFSDETNKDKHVFSPKKVFINYAIFVEVGKFLENQKEKYAYVDFSVGPAKVFKGSGFLLTLPRLRYKQRWQNDNNLSTAKYKMMGVGVSMRLYEREKEYFTQRWYTEIYAEYMKGKFEDSPFAEDKFSGIIIGVQFLR